MTFTYAGEYASDVLYRTQGAAGGVSVAVTTSADEPATLYTDATKDTPLASSTVTTDQYGNLTFFADPATYTCTVGSAAFTAVVPVNPLEPGGGGGSGTVTSLAVESANGLAGTVADATTTPQVTLSTTVTGLLKGAGGVIEAATAGTDYLTPSGSGAALTGITAAQAGADASGAASTALSSAQAFATSAVGTETTRAETAEGLLAPKASPALTGSPTAPTASALTDSTQLATTAYADSAVGVEKTRAEAAEALLAPLASPALTGSPTAPTQTSSDNTTKIATDAFVQTVAAAAQAAAEAASDPVGSAATAQSNAETYAAGLQPTSGSPLALTKGGTGVSAASDAALLSDLGAAPLASPAFTGTPAAPTASALTDSTQLATTAYADSAVAVETSRAEGAESTNASAISAETSRAETAEALKAPLASPALTGTPTAPTKAALTDSTALATTAYADAAVAVETSRAETAEALLAPLASPALTGSPTAPTKTALTDSTDIATTAYADAAVAAETSRAETAEGLKLAKASNLSDVASQQTALNNIAGAVTSGDYLRGNGSNVSMAAIQAADLPAATTSAQGAVRLDGTASDIQTVGVQAAGASGLAADAKHVHQNYANLSLLYAPTGATAETYPRNQFTATSNIVMTSTDLYVRAIGLPAGLAISNITFMLGSGTAESGGSHGWYVLLDSSYIVRAVTGDQTAATYWTTPSYTPYPLSVSASAYTTTYTGLYYVGICVVASTMPAMCGDATPASQMWGVSPGPGPLICGVSSTGQSTPPPLGTTMTTPTASASCNFYAWTS